MMWAGGWETGYQLGEQYRHKAMMSLYTMTLEGITGPMHDIILFGCGGQDLIMGGSEKWVRNFKG